MPTRADPNRLAQLFNNLLTNAAKYTEPGGHIWLTAERHGGEVAVSVKDTGIGIDTEHLGHVFETFSQVESALPRSQGGLGLGLSLVRGLAERHGGRVEAHSEGLGKGSEFVVHLPVAEGPRADKPHPVRGKEEGPKRVSGCRILVVDDNADAADCLAMLLGMMGNEVRTAYDGEAGLAEAAKFRPTMALLDIGMPKLNGYDVARRIREQPWGQDMVLLALTGWGQEEDRRLAKEAGFNHHLVKPVDAAALSESLVSLRKECHVG